MSIDTPSYETLLIEISDKVATVWLNRPDKANAMNAAMWRELQACFEWLDLEPEVRAVILAGRGTHFSAGIDLGLFAEVMPQGAEPARANEQLRLTIKRLQANLTAVERCRKPVLAAIHGSCIGGGLELVACCDMRYAATEAAFSLKEVDLGLTADVGALQRLPHIMPPGIVRELAYTGRSFDSDEACSTGLVNRVFADSEALMYGVGELARQIAAKSPVAVRGIKEMLLYGRDHSVEDGLNYVATWNSGMLSQHDVMTSLAAGPKGKPAEFDD